MAAISPQDDSKRRRFPCSRRSTTLPSKGIRTLAKAGISHPLDPLSAPEIAVAVATVRAAGASPEVRDGMRLIEVALVEPEKNIVALADAYFFPPFQSSLVPRIKARGGHHRGKVISSRVIPEVQPAMVAYVKSYSTK